VPKRFTKFSSVLNDITKIAEPLIISINLQLADIWFSDIPASNQPNNWGGYYAIILGARI
jgi:hypothetical protein